MANYDDTIKASIENRMIITVNNQDVNQTSVLDTRVDEKVENDLKRVVDAIYALLKRLFLKPLKAYHTMHVDEHGIEIMGKEQNVGISKYGFQTLINTLRTACPGKKAFQTALYKAGRMTAYRFSDDFRVIISNDAQILLPANEIVFMNQFSNYDKDCGWWSKPIDFLENTDEGYISATITGMITRYPWLGSSSGNSAFIIGYIQTLFNSCSDYLRVLHDVPFRKFVVSTTELEEDIPNLSVLHMYYTTNYIVAWKEIDKAMYLIVDELNSTHSDRNDMARIIGTFKDIRELILAEFQTDIASIPSYDNVVNHSRSALGDIEVCKERFHHLLNEIRINYEDLRIAEEKKWMGFQDPKSQYVS